MLQPINFPLLQLPNIDVHKHYNLPDTVQFCKKCVISNQRPRITFNSDGICSACQYSIAKQNTICWEDREKELQVLCKKYRNSNGYFDVVVPSSGGKDSGYVAHILRDKYKMHPLSVTWAPHWYTDIGRENLHSFVHSGFDNICFTPNGKVHRLLTRLSFINLGDPFQPFIYGQKNFPLQIAVQFGIPLIMYGENGEVEYGGDMKNAYKPTHDTTDDLVTHYFSNMPPEIWSNHGVSQSDLQVYKSPNSIDMRQINVQCHFMGYYHRWVPQELYYYVSNNTGFKPNPVGRSEGTYSKYASLDDRLDGFHYYLAYLKFGIGRCTSDAAHEIRDGHIDRDEGVQLVQRFDGEFPSRYYKDFLEYIGLTDDEAQQVFNTWRNKNLWTYEGNQWQLKTPVWR